MVVVGRTAVDDNVWHAALSGEKRERGRGINGQGRAEGNHEVSMHRRFFSTNQNLWIQTLTEADRGGFQIPTAFAKRRFAVTAKKIEVRVGVCPALTGLAFNQEICSMQFDQPPGTRSGPGVEAVDVLGHNRCDLAGRFQFRDRPMRFIRLSGAKAIPPFELEIPMLDPGPFRRHEVLEINRLAPRPHSLGPAKIGYPASG